MRRRRRHHDNQDNHPDPRRARRVRPRARRHPPARDRRPRRGGRGVHPWRREAQQQFEVAGRALFYLPPAWPLAVAALSVSKILENMEIGHNVMHGQYDWMGDPKLNSRIYDWDNVCPGEQWKYSHNYIHHTFTNILGKDRDIGYGILRMDEDQPWHPYYLGNPVYAAPADALLRVGRRHARPRGREPRQGHPRVGAEQVAARRHHAQGEAPGAQGLRPVPGADRPAVPADLRRQRHRQPDPQRLGVQHHLLRPLPGRGGDLQPRRSASTSTGRTVRRSRAATGTTASCSARPTSRAASSST